MWLRVKRQFSKNTVLKQTTFVPFYSTYTGVAVPLGLIIKNHYDTSHNNRNVYKLLQKSTVTPEV